MSSQDKHEVLIASYQKLVSSVVGTLRALSLYPKEHPEAEQKLGQLFDRLTNYLNRHPTLTLLFVGGEVVVENTPLLEVGDAFRRFISRLEAMKVHRLVFRRGLSSDELLRFLQIILRLLKNPDSTQGILASEREEFPHILVGDMPLEAGSQLSCKALSDALQATCQSVLAFSGQLKDLFGDLEGPLSEANVSIAKEITETIFKMNLNGEIPLKILIYRRSTDPDPHLHALNVSALSMALARELELKEAIVCEVGLGALLHDIGLHLYPTVPLTESAIITLDEKKRQWEHPIRGAEILLATPGMPDLVPMVAFEHHIHYNGGGFPEKKRPSELNLASLITAITNSYDNLRRKLPEQNALSLTKAIDWMDRRMGTHFHPLVFKRFRALVKAQAEENV